MLRAIHILAALLVTLIISLILVPASYYKQGQWPTFLQGGAQEVFVDDDPSQGLEAPLSLPASGGDAGQVLQVNAPDEPSIGSDSDAQLSPDKAPAAVITTSYKTVTVTSVDSKSTAAVSNALPESLSDLLEPKEPLKVAVIEANGWHDEVHAAYIYAFSKQDDIELRNFKEAPRYGIGDIIADFASPNSDKPIPKFEAWNNITNKDYVPNLLVLVTCEWEAIKLKDRLKELLALGKTYVLCNTHHADEWFGPRDDLGEVLKPWAEKKMIDFVSLSAGVSRSLYTKGFQKWPREGADKIGRSIVTFAPIFPVKLSPLDTSGGSVNSSIGLQGLFESDRRDFSSVFKHLQRLIDQGEQSEPNSKSKSASKNNIQLNLIGSGDSPPEVPAAVANKVFFHSDLAYAEYYSLLSRQTALLPAFANDGYLWNRASSSVPAALIGGVPLVVTPEILFSYPYLTEDAVYIQRPIPQKHTKDAEDKPLKQELEEDFDVVARVLNTQSIAPQAFTAKAAAVRKRRDEVLEGNVLMVREWCTGVRAKTGVFYLA